MNQHTYEYPRAALAVDCVVFGLDVADLKVLLIQRKLTPFQHTWALPGGFVRIDETIDEAARRELEEEAGVSDVYLEQIPKWVRGEITEPCRSGQRTIHIDPMGHVKRCPDFPTDFHWRDYRAYEPINCNACFYACRGEAQAPLRLSRVRDVMARPRPHALA